jgi:L-lactate dehydrogenase complex protein LldG
LKAANEKGKIFVLHSIPGLKAGATKRSVTLPWFISPYRPARFTRSPLSHYLCAMSSLTTSQAREKILSKLRNGLQRSTIPMPFPEVEHVAAATAFTTSTTSLAEHFATEFIHLGGRFIFCSDESELFESLTALFDSSGWNQLYCSEPKLMNLFERGQLKFIEPVDPSNSNADACITGCEVMVARTGSFLLSSKQHMGRVASVFYPVHIVVAFADQITGDIDEALELVRQRYGNELPSMINLNTGPSRTADIEKTLVVGVHGPKEVYCFFVNR